MSKYYAILYTEKTKRTAFVKANSESEAEKKFNNGLANTVEEYDEKIDEADIHDVWEVER